MGEHKQNYWLLCLPRQDMEHCIKIGVFGLNRKFILGRVREGDSIVCCVSKEWKIVGTGFATSEYYLDTKQCFLKEGMFPDRFDFSATLLPTADQGNLIEILDRLSFVKNLVYWAVYFRNGIAELSHDDWKTVINQLQESAHR